MLLLLVLLPLLLIVVVCVCVVVGVVGVVVDCLLLFLLFFLVLACAEHDQRTPPVIEECKLEDMCASTLLALQRPRQGGLSTN